MRTGVELLHDPQRNHGTAFTLEERERLGLRGLLPPRVIPQAVQAERVLENFHRKADDLERYILLTSLQDRNEALFHRLVMENLETVMPIIYTPTVGQACLEYCHIFSRPRGMYFSARDRGSIARILRNWPHDDVRIVVVTDGERILGLGDLGANGMGIPIGKLSLYTACAGINPATTLPVTLDVGTTNQSLIDDPFYVGLQQPRLRGAAYDDLVDEFVRAVGERFPLALIQFEDFANANAFRLLERYRDRICMFNDDIQGTAAMALAGLLSALRLTGGRLSDHRLLFLGAGEAGLGIAGLLVAAMVEEGLTPEEARGRCWFFDSCGLVVAGREHVSPGKQPYAHPAERVTSLVDAVAAIRPTVLVGVSGKGGTFTREVISAMAALNERPVVFALSNPTSRAECTAAQAYAWSDGRAIFASGSPFPPVEHAGRTLVPGQGNNAYIFPGVGLGVVAVAASRVTDTMFMAAARTLSRQPTEEDLARGTVYPSLRQVRRTSLDIASAVAEVAYESGLARVPRPRDLEAHIRAQMYDPRY